MSEKRPDRRIAKTRDALASALFALMQANDWNAITIQAICDEANVARASFYAHFDSKIALLDFMIERRVGDMAGSLASSGQDGLAVLGWLVDHVTSNRALFAKVALVPEAIPVMARFKAAVADQFAQALALESIKASDAQVQFIMGGMFDLILVWAKTWRIQEVAKLKQDVLTMAGKVLS